MNNQDVRRARMVEAQIVRRGLHDRSVLEAMRRVPRDAFVPAHLASAAYEDQPLPIEEDQTISQPYVVALMIAASELKAEERVLEIGTGSGYAAAVMSLLASKIITIERHPSLADKARALLRELGYENVEVRTGDGTLGLPAEAPFDAILATAGGPRIPDPLRDQLKVGGRLVFPLGGLARQRLTRLVRTSPSRFSETDLGGVLFVPLIGENGWSHADIRLSHSG